MAKLCNIVRKLRGRQDEISSACEKALSFTDYVQLYIFLNAVSVYSGGEKKGGKEKSQFF